MLRLLQCPKPYATAFVKNFTVRAGRHVAMNWGLSRRVKWGICRCPKTKLVCLRSTWCVLFTLCFVTEHYCSCWSRFVPVSVFSLTTLMNFDLRWPLPRGNFRGFHAYRLHVSMFLELWWGKTLLYLFLCVLRNLWRHLGVIVAKPEYPKIPINHTNESHLKARTLKRTHVLACTNIFALFSSKNSPKILQTV